jgi:hypothetical protein
MLYLGVGVARYRDPAFPALPAAKTDVNRLRPLFEDRGHRAAVLPSPRSGTEVSGFVDAHAAGHTAALLHWAGHAVVNPGGDLLLATNESRSDDVAHDKVRAEDLIDQIVAAGVRQLMVVMDTCGAASGMLEALRSALARIERGSAELRKDAWIGVLATSQSDGTAVDGAFGRAFHRLLRTGPRGRADRVHWNAYNAAVRGVDVAHAAHSAWDGGRAQQFAYQSIGWSQPILPNPLYDPAAPPASLGALAGGPAPSTKDLRTDLADHAELTPLVRVLAAAEGRGMPARDVWPWVAAALRPDEQVDDDDLNDVIDKFGRHLLIDSEYGQAVFRLANPHARRSLLDVQTSNEIDHAVIRLFRDQSRRSGVAVNPYLREHVRAHVRRAGRIDRPTPRSAEVGDRGRLRSLLADARGVLGSAAHLLSTAVDAANSAALAGTLASLAARAGDLSEEVGDLETGLRTDLGVDELVADGPRRAIEA